MNLFGEGRTSAKLIRTCGKKQILDAVKETNSWLDEHGATATTEEFQEQKERLSNVAYPITSRMYGQDRSDQGDHEGMHGQYGSDYGDHEPFGHDEL